MVAKRNFSNPFQTKKHRDLTAQIRAATVEGGTEGSDVTSPEATAAFSADSEQELGATLVMLLDAIVGLHQAAVVGDRKALDEDYESVISLCEVYRDATPKA